MLAFVMNEKHAFPWETKPMGINDVMALNDKNAVWDGQPERSPEEIACCPNGCQSIAGGHECAAYHTPEQPPDVPSEPTLADTVALIQADMRFAVRFTAVLVRSDNAALRMVVNTERGQLMPLGRVTFSDGSTVEFQDVGMPQPNVPTMTVQELVKTAFSKATELGLEIA